MKNIRTIAACAALMTALSCACTLAPSVSAKISADSSISVTAAKKSGWVTKDGNKYYYGKDGKAATGWKKIGGKKYYFGKDGVMRTGKKKIGGKSYTFDENGVLQEGTSKKKASAKIKFGMSMDQVQKALESKYNFILPVNETTLVAGPEFSQKNLSFYFFNEGGLNAYGEMNEKDKSETYKKTLEKAGFTYKSSPSPGFLLYVSDSSVAFLYSPAENTDSSSPLFGETTCTYCIFSPEWYEETKAHGFDIEKDFSKLVEEYF